MAWLQFSDHLRQTGRRFYFALASLDILVQLAAAQMHRTASGGCRYPDCCATYLRLRKLSQRDRSMFWRYFFNEIDWSVTCNAQSA